MAADVASLLRTATREGFLMAALAGLAATAASDYRRMRRELQLSTYTEGEIGALSRAARFVPVREPRNLGFNARRMTFTLRPAGCERWRRSRSRETYPGFTSPVSRPPS